MLRWSILLFLAAIVAAVLGFGGIVEGATDVAMVLLVVLLVLAIGGLVIGRRAPT